MIVLDKEKIYEKVMKTTNSRKHWMCWKNTKKEK